MTTGTYPIVGIQDGLGPDGSRPLRYEINQFVDPSHNPHAKAQLNLFLLALERIQAMSREERLSWFQIGGIHGEPYVDWDGSAGTVQPGGGQWLGYCTHGSILFPTWHRVYVALIEQAVHACMKQVLGEFPPEQQVALKPAVEHWRYPYWDWALPLQRSTRLFVPELMAIPKIDVQRPSGLTETIDNPMYRYPFPLNSSGKIDGINDVIEDGGQVVPFSQAPYTVRHPLMYDATKPFSSQATWAQGISDNNAVQNSLNNGEGPRRPGGKQLVTEVYHLFSMMRKYPPFSNTRWTGSGSVPDYMSLEGVHNNVHVFIGGMTYGHMSENEVAAFDPAFWMHHGNVERLLSIFQALNPADYANWPNDKWISGTQEPWFTDQSQVDAQGTWTRKYGENEQATSLLTPFSKDTNGTIYDSDGCRNINILGYAFEELQDWLPKYHASGSFNEPLYCKDIRKKLIQKYGWALPTLNSVRRIALGVHHDLPSAEPRAVPATERTYSEYVINVLVDRFANRGQTFVVNFFLGGVPELACDWENAEKLGIVSIFGGSQYIRGKCSNCTSQADSEDENARLVTGQLSITAALVDLVQTGTSVGGEVLKTLDKAEVGHYLKKHLHWRVSGLGNKELDIHKIPSLKVSVAVAAATLPIAEDEFVQYGEFEVLDAPTRGRLSGFDSAKDRF